MADSDSLGGIRKSDSNPRLVEIAMSGFDLAELLPFYLDETDEHIAGLNDALLRLEQDPADAKALQEAFRMFHSIKGASVVMGFAAGQPADASPGEPVRAAPEQEARCSTGRRWT